MKNVKQANINVTKKKLFRQWLDITSAFHGLTNQQQNILALFLFYHYEFAGEITNNRVLWKMVFDYDTKAKIKKELDISDPVLQNNLTQFRKKGIIQNNKIVGTYIPNLTQDANNFKVIFNFNILNE